MNLGHCCTVTEYHSCKFHISVVFCLINIMDITPNFFERKLSQYFTKNIKNCYFSETYVGILKQDRQIVLFPSLLRFYMAVFKIWQSNYQEKIEKWFAKMFFVLIIDILVIKIIIGKTVERHLSITHTPGQENTSCKILR